MTRFEDQQDPFEGVPDLDERVCEWVDGTMAPRERERFEAELRVSPALRRQVDDYERTVQDLRDAFQQPIEDVAVADRVMETLATQATEAAARGPRVLPMFWALASAAALLAVAVWVDDWAGRGADAEREATASWDAQGVAAPAQAPSPDVDEEAIEEIMARISALEAGPEPGEAAAGLAAADQLSEGQLSEGQRSEGQGDKGAELDAMSKKVAGRRGQKGEADDFYLGNARGAPAGAYGGRAAPGASQPRPPAPDAAVGAPAAPAPDAVARSVTPVVGGHPQEEAEADAGAKPSATATGRPSDREGAEARVVEQQRAATAAKSRLALVTFEIPAVEREVLEAGERDGADASTQKAARRSTQPSEQPAPKPAPKSLEEQQEDVDAVPVASLFLLGPERPQEDAALRAWFLRELRRVESGEADRVAPRAREASAGALRVTPLPPAAGSASPAPSSDWLVEGSREQLRMLLAVLVKVAPAPPKNGEVAVALPASARDDAAGAPGDRPSTAVPSTAGPGAADPARVERIVLRLRRSR